MLDVGLTATSEKEMCEVISIFASAGPYQKECTK
jgi:hypothetical protein